MVTNLETSPKISSAKESSSPPSTAFNSDFFSRNPPNSDVDSYTPVLSHKSKNGSNSQAKVVDTLISKPSSAIDSDYSSRNPTTIDEDGFVKVYRRRMRRLSSFANNGLDNQNFGNSQLTHSSRLPSLTQHPTHVESFMLIIFRIIYILQIQTMRKLKKPGAVMNMVSAAGLYPMPADPIYSASKEGVVLFTRSCALLGREGIRVNTLCPELLKFHEINFLPCSHLL